MKIIYSVAIVLSITVTSCGIEPKNRIYYKENDSFSKICASQVSFYFVNGISNNYYEASETAANISFRSKIRFNLIYNESPGFTSAIKALLNIKSLSNSGTEGSILSALNSLSGNPYSDSDINEMSKVKFDLYKNKRVFLVAHSYGNVFANKICTENDGDIKTIHLANPTANKTRCEVDNVSFKSDRVLNALKIALIKVREQNFVYSGPQEKTSVTGYHDAEYLLSDPVTGPRIFDRIKSEYQLSHKKIYVSVNDGFAEGRTCIMSFASQKCQNKREFECNKNHSETLFSGSKDNVQFVVNDGGEKTYLQSNQSTIVSAKVESGDGFIHIAPNGKNESIAGALAINIKGVLLEYFKGGR